jgi:hypothetical protein
MFDRILVTPIPLLIQLITIHPVASDSVPAGHRPAPPATKPGGTTDSLTRAQGPGATGMGQGGTDLPPSAPVAVSKARPGPGGPAMDRW